MFVKPKYRALYMITFYQFLEQQDNLDENLMGKIAAGAGLLAAGLGAGYGLRGGGTPSSSTTYPAAQDFMPKTTQVSQSENDYDSLVKDYIEKNKNSRKYNSTTGKNFRNINADAHRYAATIIKGKGGNDSNGNDSNGNDAKKIARKQGTVED